MVKVNTATSSGAVSISTSDGGTAGVSGNIGLTTSDTADGNTGSDCIYNW